MNVPPQISENVIRKAGFDHEADDPLRSWRNMADKAESESSEGTFSGNHPTAYFCHLCTGGFPIEIKWMRKIFIKRRFLKLIKSRFSDYAVRETAFFRS